MFGGNKQRTYRDYAMLDSDMLFVTSVFYTLQGEGPFAGQPAVFVRLTGCHLACSFCDTWFDSGHVQTFHEIEQRIDTLAEQAWKHGAPIWGKQGLLVVVTGGEPMLQANLPRFLQRLQNHRCRTQIETAGSFWLQDIPHRTHIVCSPKVNAATKQYMGVNTKLLDRIDSLKFIVSATEAGYTDIPHWAINWAYQASPTGHRRVYVSPMNCYLRPPKKLDADASIEARSEYDERISFWEEGLLDRAANQRNHEHAAALALKYGAILSLQQHLYANLP
jgi:7-carboxy-7-deazaguanine synthase